MLIVGIPPHEVLVDGVPLDHKGSCKVYNHSPTGFSWGYGGSGPSQLALAILLLFLSVRPTIYNNFVPVIDKSKPVIWFVL